MSGFDRSGPDEIKTPDSPRIMCVTAAKYPGGELELTFALPGELSPKTYSLSREVAAALIDALANLLV